MSTSIREHILRFEAASRQAGPVLKILKAAEAKVLRVKRDGHNEVPNTWSAYVRLPRYLEEHFGLTREFLLYCVPTGDLQTRHVTRIRALIREAENPIETDFAMLVADDPAVSRKIADWGIERTMGLVLVPTSTSKLDEHLEEHELSDALRKLLQDWVSARNFYDERDPVSGDRFFGRSKVLRELDRGLAQGEGHAGVFGLRRIGKTSVLRELIERLDQRSGVVPIFVDLEATTSVRHAGLRVGQELAATLSRYSSLSERAAVATLRIPDSSTELDPDELFARLGDALRSTLTGGALEGMHLVLMLDEAESVLPSAGKPSEHAVDFFRVIRGVAQETGRLNLVLAGVNATPSESPYLGDDDNPLFGLLSIHYLGPLEPAECHEMIRTLGRKMQVRWDGRGVEVLTEAVGAHPLLARLVASEVTKKFEDRPLRPSIEMVEGVLEEFRSRAGLLFQQMLQSLDRYYPDELDLLKLVAQGELEFANDLLEDNPSLGAHLQGYGVLDQSRMQIPVPMLRTWLREIS